jgi:hypothetical protein
MKKILIVILTLMAIATSAFGQIADQNFLGRWYTEEETTSEPDESGTVTHMKICVSEEYFRNHINNFQGTAQIDYTIGDTSIEGGAVIALRGAAEWQLADEVLTSKIIDIKTRIKDVYLRRQGDDVEGEDLQTFKDAMSEELNSIFYVGMTTEDTVLSFDAQRITTESTDDNGVKKVTHHYRAQKLLDGCR